MSELNKKYIVHIVQPVSTTTIGGADMHVLDLVSLQKDRDDIIPIVCIRWNKTLKIRIESLGVVCFCGEECQNSLEYVLFLNEKLREYNISIVHSHGYDANFQYLALRLLAIKRMSKVKFVITSHGWIENTFALKLKTRLDFLTHSFADSHIVCAQNNLTRLRDNSINYYIPNGIVPFTYEKKYNERLRVGFVGRLSKEKRPDVFIEVARKIIAKNKNIMFNIYGEGDEIESINNLIKLYNLEQNVCLMGQKVNRSDIFSNIEILLLPSDTESTPRVLIEALSCGIPVVATNVGDVSHIVINNETGFFVNMRDVEGLTKCIFNLIEDDSLRKKMGENGIKHFIENLSALRMEQQVYNVYINLL